MIPARRAIVFSYSVPQPDRDGGSKRINDVIALLQESGWSVTFISSQPLVPDSYLSALRQRGVGVFHGESAFFEDLISAIPFDLAVFAFWPTAELYLPVLRQRSPMTRAIVDSIDLHFLRHARRITTGSFGPSRLLDARYGDQFIGELNVYSAADAVLTVSPQEADWVNGLLGASDLAWSVPLNDEFPFRKRPFGDRQGILFVGSFRHGPNVDAIEWLCRRVLPLIPDEIRTVHPVYVVGDGLDDRVRGIAGNLPTVRLVGWVPSLLPYLEQARVSVLPLISGAGTKQKMIQALLAGTPVVSTSVGAEGFELESGRDLLIANDPERFAASVVEVLADEALWKKLARNGRARILASHGRDATRKALFEAIDAVMDRPPKGPILEPTGPEHHHERLVYQYEAGKFVPLPPVTLAGPEIGLPASTPNAAPVPTGQVEIRVVNSGLPDAAPATEVRAIAFYLPQFHTIPENDAWWGEGFTEWTNVRSARPLFAGHDQPEVPTELGYYDLRDPQTRAAQAELAAQHGIHGFCYYHYWFSGKQLLEAPLDAVLASGEPDFPFCVCWANEPWSRRWDGSENDILMPQAYSREDDLRHIQALMPALADPRAITVDGKRLLMIYQGQVLPEPAWTTNLWRTEVARAGLGDLQLLAVETGWDAGWDATKVGFDGKVLFQPQFTMLKETPRTTVPGYDGLQVYDYGKAWPHLAAPEPVDYLRYESVFPRWDNTARRGDQGLVVHASTPGAYERWLRQAVARARQRPSHQRLVFINAWNEWAEGCYLEPDATSGRKYLEATKRALCGSAPAGDKRKAVTGPRQRPTTKKRNARATRGR